MSLPAGAWSDQEMADVWQLVVGGDAASPQPQFIPVLEEMEVRGRVGQSQCTVSWAFPRSRSCSSGGSSVGSSKPSS